MTKSIVLIHGAWLTPLSWEFFKKRYEDKGYAVHTPPWPHEDVPLEQLRASPPAELKKLTVGKIVDHYDAYIRKLPEAPIIIGHSYGGLLTQKLLDRGLGACGVALDPAPIRGVFPPPRVLRSALPVFTTFGSWNRVLTMSYDSFATTFAQTLPENLKRPYYDRYIAPTPGRIYWQGALGIGTGIHRKNPKRPPLLLGVGEKDITITPFTVMKAYQIQAGTPSRTCFKTFPGRSHFLFAEPGWEDVADYALDWAAKNAKN